MKLNEIEYFAEDGKVWVIDGNTHSIVGIASSQDEAENMATTLNEITQTIIDHTNYHHVRTGKRIIQNW